MKIPGSNHKILVVEDDEAIRNLCERALKKDYAPVRLAYNGEKAKEILRNEKFDMVITDLNMPGSIDGTKLLEEIKAQSPSTDVVIMTSFPSLETAIPTLKKGAYDYLIKPIDPELLQSLVRRCFEKRELSEELNREKILREELQAAYSELQKVEKLKEAFLSRLSHELKTPVALAQPALELIKEPNLLDSQRQKFYEILKRAIDRMQGTVENLLLFSDVSGKSLVLSKTKTNLRKLLERVIAKYQALCEEKGIKIEPVFEEALDLEVDPPLMEVALKHLLINAIQFNKKDGKIIIQGQKERDHIRISFSDTGIGIPQGQLDKIFDSFYQVAEYLTRQVDGLGLGLAIVKRIIEAHGGNIHVQSLPNQGSTFTVVLPFQGSHPIQGHHPAS